LYIRNQFTIPASEPASQPASQPHQPTNQPPTHSANQPPPGEGECFLPYGNGKNGGVPTPAGGVSKVTCFIVQFLRALFHDFAFKRKTNKQIEPFRCGEVPTRKDVGVFFYAFLRAFVLKERRMYAFLYGIPIAGGPLVYIFAWYSYSWCAMRIHFYMVFL
jgi:hypothetical protein